MSIHSREPSCWTAKVLDAFQGLRRCNVFVQAVRQSVPISIQDFTDEFKHRLRCVWRNVEGVDLQGSSIKLATYHALFTVPFDTTTRASAYLPRHLFLELSQRVLQTSVVSDLWHTNRVVTATWKFGTSNELMELLLTGEDQLQADQPNNLAEGHPM